MAAGSRPRGGCTSGTGVIPATGCFFQAVTGSPGPPYLFPTCGDKAKDSGNCWGLGGLRGLGQHPTAASSPGEQVTGLAGHSMARCPLTAERELPQCGQRGWEDNWAIKIHQ